MSRLALLLPPNRRMAMSLGCPRLRPLVLLYVPLMLTDAALGARAPAYRLAVVELLAPHRMLVYRELHLFSAAALMVTQVVAPLLIPIGSFAYRMPLPPLGPSTWSRLLIPAQLVLLLAPWHKLKAMDVCPLLRPPPLPYAPAIANDAAPGVLLVRMRLTLLSLAIPPLLMATALLLLIRTTTGLTIRHLLGVPVLASPHCLGRSLSAPALSLEAAYA